MLLDSHSFGSKLCRCEQLDTTNKTAMVLAHAFFACALMSGSHAQVDVATAVGAMARLVSMVELSSIAHLSDRCVWNYGDGKRHKQYELFDWSQRRTDVCIHMNYWDDFKGDLMFWAAKPFPHALTIHNVPDDLWVALEDKFNWNGGYLTLGSIVQVLEQNQYTARAGSVRRYEESTGHDSATGNSLHFIADEVLDKVAEKVPEKVSEKVDDDDSRLYKAVPDAAPVTLWPLMVAMPVAVILIAAWMVARPSRASVRDVAVQIEAESLTAQMSWHEFTIPMT